MMFEFCWHDQGALRFFLSHYFTILDTCRKHLLPMFDSMDTLRNTPFALVCQLASYTLKITEDYQGRLLRKIALHLA